jgi:hypothetical protein
LAHNHVPELGLCLQKIKIKVAGKVTVFGEAIMQATKRVFSPAPSSPAAGRRLTANISRTHLRALVQIKDFTTNQLALDY